MKYALIGLLLSITCVTSFFMGRSSLQSDTELGQDEVSLTQEEYQNLNRVQDEAEKVVEEMQGLSQIELEEYLTLKDQKDKYKKADELLAKVFQLFLANVGLHLSQKQKDWLAAQEVRDKELKEKDYKEADTGPEVIIDPYGKRESDLKNKIKELENKLKEAKEPQKKKVNLKEKDFVAFKDKFPYGGPFVDGDVKRQQWQNKDPLELKDLQPVLLDHITPYIQTQFGEYRQGSSEYKVSIGLLLEKESTDNDVKMELNIQSEKTIISMKRTFQVFHPKTHNGGGGGACRAIVLNDKNFQIHFIRLKDKNDMIVRIWRHSQKNPFSRIDGKPNKKEKPFFLGNIYINSSKSGQHGYDYSGRR